MNTLQLSSESLLIIAFATYRLTLLFSRETGPKDIFEWIRFNLGARRDEHSREIATGFWSELILCPYCFSIWVGIAVTIFVVLAPSAGSVVLLPFALSGISVFFFKWAGV